MVQTCSACPTNIYQAALDVRVRIEFAQLPIIMRCRFLTAAEEEGDYHLNGPSVSCFVASLASRSSMAGLSARMAAQPGTPQSESGSLQRKRKAHSVMHQLQMTAQSGARSRDAAR